MHYCLLLLIVSPLTLGLGYFVWMHRLCGRIGGELARRRKEILLTSASFWLWHVLGCLILIGPLVFIHKLAVATNTLADDFNAHG